MKLLSSEVLAATRDLIGRYRSVTEQQWKEASSVAALIGVRISALGKNCLLCEAARYDCTRCIHRCGHPDEALCTRHPSYRVLFALKRLGIEDWALVYSALSMRAEYLEGLLKEEENR